MKNRCFACAVVLFLASSASARLTRFVVEQTSASGPAQALTGRFYGELDPKDSHNRIITDIESAPRNAQGMVEYSATFSMVVPAETSGVLMYSVANRGNGAPVSVNGNVGIVSGWQGDVVPRNGVQTISVPVAKGLTGPVVARFINMAPNTTTLSLATAV
ncbi:MAG TPA: hypothetical protein VK789_14765, partial [Bryobacteraceae bacterium]|nr:hypothetical protein [Bryobacteraceae bacterium]